MSELAIQLKGVSKKYSIGKEKDGSLRGTLASIFSKKSRKQEDFWALKDVSFDIQKGDIIGIIGKNGAGKSTLLKVLSQITRPTEGRIEINGRVASLLEVGTGFHPELTGRENVYLNGTILGMTRKEVTAKFDEIVAFSGIEKFIDTPVKHYSSGMYVRLAFAVAAHLEPEILIIDEVLAVGDAEFQKKCLGKMKDVAGEGRTVIFVSHQLGSVKTLCNKGVLMTKGKISKVGSISDVITAYQVQTQTKSVYENFDSEKSVYLKKAELDSDLTEFSFNEEIKFIFEIEGNNTSNSKSRILVRIIDEFENVVLSFEKEVEKNNYKLKIEPNTLKKGKYYLNLIIYQPAVQVFENIDVCDFSVIDNNSHYAHLETFDCGKIYANEKWME